MICTRSKSGVTSFVAASLAFSEDGKGIGANRTPFMRPRSNRWWPPQGPQSLRRSAIAAVCWLLLIPDAVADIYRWVDAEGGVHFGDTLPPNTTGESLGSPPAQSGTRESGDEYSILNQLQRLSASRADRKSRQDPPAATRTVRRPPPAGPPNCWPPGAYCGPGRRSFGTYYGPFPGDHPVYWPERLPYGPLHPLPARQPRPAPTPRTRLWIGN